MTEPSPSGEAAKSDQKLSLLSLIALVVGSMIGSGIFALPSAFGRATGGLGAMIAWAIAGGGMLMLAFVFQTLSNRKPDLDSGVYIYAKAGFGNYLGFAAAFGYWMGCCFADAACLILIKSTLGLFFPIFGDGTTPTALVSATALLWGVHFLVLRGVKEAAFINSVATVAKIVPIFIFIIIAFVGFQSNLFALNFSGTGAYQPGENLDLYHVYTDGETAVQGAESVYQQVRGTMYRRSYRGLAWPSFHSASTSILAFREEQILPAVRRCFQFPDLGHEVHELHNVDWRGRIKHPGILQDLHDRCLRGFRVA